MPRRRESEAGNRDSYAMVFDRLVISRMTRHLWPKLPFAAIALAPLLAAGGCAFISTDGTGDAPAAEEAARRDMQTLEDPDARRIVDRVLAEHDLAGICAQGVETVKESVRASVIKVMVTDGLSNPRDSGTTAGHFISDRCPALNPDY